MIFNTHEDMDKYWENLFGINKPKVVNEYEIWKTMGEIQTKAYDMWKVGMTAYYETWIKPFYEAWCKDIHIDWSNKS